MHTRLFLVLVISGIISIPISAQPVVKGSVFDNNTHEALPGVHIVYSSNQGVLTDGNGQFEFYPNTGTYIISFTFVGYQHYERHITLNNNDTLFLNIGLNESVSSINEIVVTAGRTAQRISDLSVSMTVLKPYQISRNHIINAEELLHKTTGIEIMDGQASIRGGSGYSYGAGSRVITLVDGLPALSADAGNIKWGTLPIENISRIEVIKGASSVLYGSSALNGVINFITRDASEDAITKFSISAGIFDNPSRIEWKWWDKPRMTENLSFSHSQQYGNSEIGLGLRLMNDNGYRFLNDDRNARLNLSLKQHGKQNESLLYGISFYGSINAKNDFLLWDNAIDGALIQDESTAMEYRGVSIAFDPFISFEGSREGVHDFRARVLTNLNRLPDNTNNNSDSHSAFIEYQYSYTISENISTVAGAVQNYSIINSNFYGDHSGVNFSGYAQFDFSITDRVKAVSGFRLEKYILDGEADKMVPILRAGLNIKAGVKSFLRASIGQGYRYPSIAEKHANTIVGAIQIIPNEDIKSESGWSSEIGFKNFISKDLISGQIDIAAFYSQNKDMIEYVFGSHPEIGFKPINIENSRVYGLEAEILLNRSFGLFNTTFKAGYTFMYPVEYNSYTNKNTEDYLKYRRKHSSNLSLSTIYRKIDIGFMLFYKSKILDIDDVFVNESTREDILPGFYDYWLENNNAYFLLDLSTSYRINENYSASITIKNLGNKEYMGRPGDIQPHRYYSLMLRGSF